MKNKGLLILVSVVLVMGLLLSVLGCGAQQAQPTTTKPTSTTPTTPTTPTAAPKAIKWKGQNAYVTAPPWGNFKKYTGTGMYGNFYVDWIADATNKQLTVDLAPPGGIIPVAEMFNAVKQGVIDIAALYYGGYHTGVMPEANVEIGLPFAWEDPAEAWDALYNRGLYEEFQKIYLEHGIHFYFVPSWCRYTIGTTFPINSLADIKGKKIRALGIYGDFVKALGGSPTVVAWGDLYMALKLGTIDGLLADTTSLEDIKLKEVLKYYIWEPNFNLCGCSYLINEKAFQALPDNIKTLLDRDSKYATLSLPMNYYMQRRISEAAAAKDYGIKFVSLSAEDAAKARAIGIGLWDQVASQSARCAKLVDIVKQQARDLGKIK